MRVPEQVMLTANKALISIRKLVEEIEPFVELRVGAWGSPSR